MPTKPTKLLLVVDYGDGPEFDHADAEQLAKILQDMQYGHADLALFGVYALGADCKPVEVRYAVEGRNDFNSDGWAFPLVTVTLPDGTTETASYSVDGYA